MRVINKRVGAKYCIRIYLFFSDNSRKKIELYFGKEDDIDTLDLAISIELRKAVRERAANVYLQYADYSAITLYGEAEYYVCRWLDETTGATTFASVLWHLAKLQMEGEC